MQREWREGDIVRWFYTEKELEKRRHHNNGGTTYWCCSNIAIFHEKKGRFYDTYWGGSGDNKSFSLDDINNTHGVTFIANFDELDKIENVNEYYVDGLYKQYDEKDVVNLTHSNSFRPQIYLRKGAKKNIDLMRESYQRKINEIENKIDHLNWTLIKTKEEFENLTEENYQESKAWL